MTFSKFALEICSYLLIASLYLIQRFSSKIFIHSFHAGSHALMNDFKSSCPEENITKSCIFKSNYFFWGYFSDVEIKNSKNQKIHLKNYNLLFLLFRLIK